jgi:hypothetical protein
VSGVQPPPKLLNTKVIRVIGLSSFVMGLVHLPLLVPVFSQGRSRAIGELVCWRVGGSVMGLCAKWMQENFLLSSLFGGGNNTGRSL